MAFLALVLVQVRGNWIVWCRGEYLLSNYLVKIWSAWISCVRVFLFVFVFLLSLSQCFLVLRRKILLCEQILLR
jgi:hypothetical protein